MPRLGALPLLLYAVLVLGAEPAEAMPHGAMYGPPPWTGPGDTRGVTRGPVGPGAPPPPGATPPSAGTPGAGLPTAPGAPGGASGPMSASAAGLDLTGWYWWWQFNQEPFLNLRQEGEPSGAMTGGDGFFLGHGHRPRTARIDRRPDAETIRTRILPGLKDALFARASKDLVTASLVALARVGDDLGEEERREIEGMLALYLRDANQEIAETATAALGILGRDATAPLLTSILLDAPAGRTACGGNAVPERTRAFAAYALGILGAQSTNEDVRRYIVHHLPRAFAAGKGDAPDLPVACVAALGRVPLRWKGEWPAAGAKGADVALPPTASREGQILHLLEVLEDAKANRLVRAHAATSVAVLLQSPGEGRGKGIFGRVGSSLLASLSGARRTPREVRQSCAIALGMVGDDDGDALDAKIRRALQEAAEQESDLGTRHFAMIAVGRVGGRRGQGEDAGSLSSRAFLLRELGRGSVEMRRWAALSLAILERGRREARLAPDDDVSQGLHLSVREARTSSDVASMSLACGILGDREGTKPVLAQFDRQSEDTARGLVAVALGLLDAQEALDPLHRAVADAAYRPDTLRGTAVGLALLGDPEVVDVLTGLLRTTKSLAARAAVTRALGRVGDAQAVEPLLALLNDTEATDAARAFAAIALGLVADRDPLPWNTILTVNTNYLAAPATLFDTGGYGVLNIL